MRSWLPFFVAVSIAAPTVLAQPLDADTPPEAVADPAEAEDPPPEDPDAAPVAPVPEAPPLGEAPTGSTEPQPTAPPDDRDPIYPPGPIADAPPPPEAPEGSGGFEMPPWSARIDPFNWLLEGRLGVELEVGLLDFLTVELVPTFVVQKKPPTLNLSGAPDVLEQESNGLGPLSGAAVDVGFWLDGTAFHGYVIRVGFATYGYSYNTVDDGGPIDSVDVTERQAFAMFGSQASWGAFTLAGGIGLGVELNRQQRCFADGTTAVSQVQTDGCDDALEIATDRATIDPVDLNGGLFPVTLIGRFSLGVLFD
ncbi:MAG TPA: hypothetical protein PKD61_04090 [Polyangiaceae bacterium]|nr:hypothetical protein [Polyangiaceae bacterium]